MPNHWKLWQFLWSSEPQKLGLSQLPQWIRRRWSSTTHHRCTWAVSRVAQDGRDREREREDLEVERSFSCFFTPRNWDGKYGRLRTTGDDILFQTSIHDELRICWSRPPPVETELSFRGTDPAWRMQRSSAPMLSWRWVSSLGTAATLWPWGCYSRRLFPGISQGNIMGRTLARKNTTNETSLIHDKIDV